MAENNTTTSFFSKDNYIWMLVGLVLIAIAMFMMAGGKSDNPNVFNPKEVYGFWRVTVAPVLIMIGLVIEIYAIFRKPKG
jgi:uncharacterized membrane protein